jgi:hypothetical protein
MYRWRWINVEQDSMTSVWDLVFKKIYENIFYTVHHDIFLLCLKKRHIFLYFYQFKKTSFSVFGNTGWKLKIMLGQRPGQMLMKQTLNRKHLLQSCKLRRNEEKEGKSKKATFGVADWFRGLGTKGMEGADRRAYPVIVFSSMFFIPLPKLLVTPHVSMTSMMRQHMQAQWSLETVNWKCSSSCNRERMKQKVVDDSDSLQSN